MLAILEAFAMSSLASLAAGALMATMQLSHHPCARDHTACAQLLEHNLVDGNRTIIRTTVLCNNRSFFLSIHVRVRGMQRLQTSWPAVQLGDWKVLGAEACQALPRLF